MARKYHRLRPASGVSGARYEDAAHEMISEDEPYADTRFGRNTRIEGDMLGMNAEELLAFAIKKMREEHGLVDKLMQHLPRKFEERIKALRDPRHEAERAVVAASILVGNARKPLEGDKDGADS